MSDTIMPEQLLQRIDGLVKAGTQLAPLGGFEFSGYNARLQNKYLEWRKGCLEALEEAGPIAVPYKNKVMADGNGGYFFQSSAQLLVTSMRELLEKLKASPELLKEEAPAAAPEPAAAAPAPSSAPPGARVIKPPPKQAPAAPAQQEPAKAGGLKHVYVIGEAGDALRIELSQFLQEIGLDETFIPRTHGQMVAVNEVKDDPGAKYAFFVFSSEDVGYAMFELGHFVGKLGPNHVTVLHMTDVQFPANIPGVSVRPIVVRLEEASFGIIKELKAAGYSITI